MSDVPFHLTKSGRQFLEATMPELVRQLTRLNDLLALGVELMEKNGIAKDDSGTSDEAASSTRSKK